MSKILGSMLLGRGSPIVVNDAFTDTNGVALSAHTIAPTNKPATAWTIASGTWTIQGNQASNTGGNPAKVTLDGNKANGTVSVNIILAGGDFAGIMFRGTDAVNYYSATINASDGKLSLYDGSPLGGTLIQQAAAGVSAGPTYLMTVTMSGNDFSVLCNGTTVSGNNATRNTATICGLMEWGNGSTFDDFKISA